MEIKNIKENHFIYNENPTVGTVLIVESGQNTCEIRKVKAEDKSVYTVNAPWWDLDGINREVKKNEKAITKAMYTFVLNGCIGKVAELHKDFENLPKTDQDELRTLIKDKFSI